MNQELTIADPESVKKKRRIYSDDFKCELVQKCSHPHVSIASVALQHGINTNLLNRWVKQASRKDSIPNLKTVQGFIALPMTAAPANQEICFKIHLQTSSQVIQLTWPVTEMKALATLIRELTS